MTANSDTGQTDETEEFLDRMRLPQGHVFNPDHSITRIFSVVSNRASLVLQSMYGERFGLSVLGWRILAILGSHAPLPAKTISQMIATDQVTISRAIEQLSNKRLIRRRVDPSDRRRQLLRLSERGVTVYEQIIPLFAAVENAVLSPLNPDEQDELRRLVRIVMEQTETVLGEESSWQEVLARYGHRVDDGD